MRASIAFGICLLLFGLFGDDHSFRAMLQARQNARALAGQLAALRAENTLLRQRADALRNDPATIESTARETLGFTRPGEIVVRVRR